MVYEGLVGAFGAGLVEGASRALRLRGRGGDFLLSSVVPALLVLPVGGTGELAPGVALSLDSEAGALKEDAADEAELDKPSNGGSAEPCRFCNVSP